MPGRSVNPGMRPLSCLSLVAALVAAVPHHVDAQSTFATLTGIVSDESGAVPPRRDGHAQQWGNREPRTEERATRCKGSRTPARLRV